MLEDEELGPNLIETLKSQGIHQLADHGLLVRARFTANPGEQFVISARQRRSDASLARFARRPDGAHTTGAHTNPPGRLSCRSSTSP
jgi:hypothetical protein